MGNQQSSAVAISDTVNKSVTNVLMQNSSQCGQNNSGLQSVSFSNIKTAPGFACSLNINSSQKFSQIPSFSCLSNSTQTANLQSQLSAALSAAVKSETSGLGGALNSTSNSSTTSKIINDISTNVNISNTATCLQNNLANQEAVFQAIESSCPKICNQEFVPTRGATGQDYAMELNAFSAAQDKCVIKIGSAQELVQAATAACTSENVALTAAINKAAAEVSQMSTSENSGTNLSKLVSSLFAGLTGPIIYSIIGCVLLVCIICIGLVAFSLSPAGQVAVSTVSSAAADKLKNY